LPAVADRKLVADLERTMTVVERRVESAKSG
jgi:hypothetical protein